MVLTTSGMHASRMRFMRGKGIWMLSVDPFTPSPGSVLDQMFEVRVFAQKQVGLLGSAIRFDVVGSDGVVSGVQFDKDGGQVGGLLASQMYEDWFFAVQPQVGDGGLV